MRSNPKINQTNKPNNNTRYLIIALVILFLATASIFLAVAISNGAFEKSPDDIPSSRSTEGNEIRRLDKPIIYLYPEAETEVSIKLGYPEKLTVVYPAYNKSGWRVLAKPSGELVDLNTGRSLYALYWEGEEENKPELDEGFVVAGSDTTAFLEEKLAILGLTEREAEEFIIYWLPKMQDNAYNLIRFETLEEINASMPLAFSVEPDPLIRVMMDFKPLEEKIEVKEQALPKTPARNGFTVVEWGGSEIH